MVPLTSGKLVVRFYVKLFKVWSRFILFLYYYCYYSYLVIRLQLQSEIITDALSLLDLLKSIIILIEICLSHKNCCSIRCRTIKELVSQIFEHEQKLL